MMVLKTAKQGRLPGRPRGFDTEHALDAAMHVFWEKGYEGASLHDLTTAMGIQPTSLYKAFGNKKTLFGQALARYLAGPVAFIRGALSEPTAYAVAERTLRESAHFLADPHNRCGCMTIQAALVGGKESQAVREELIALRVSGQEALRERFERAQEEGDLTRSADAGDLARFVTTIFQGMTVQAINGASVEELLRLKDTALRAWPKQLQDH
jgi:AcrR family transcriptional regulator